MEQMTFTFHSNDIDDEFQMWLDALSDTYLDTDDFEFQQQSFN